MKLPSTRDMVIAETAISSGDLVLLYKVERGEVEILSLMRLDTHSDLDL